MSSWSKELKIGIGVALIIALVGVLFYLNTKDKNKYNWIETYAYDSDEPYGTDILFDFLKDYDDDEKIELIEKQSISSFLEAKDAAEIQENNTYIIIGNRLEFVARDYESLYDFMLAGNTVMIVSEDVDNLLLEKINRECAPDNYGSNSSLYLNTMSSFSTKVDFENESLKNRKGYTFFYEFGGKRYNHSYAYFGSNFCRAQTYETLSTIRPNKVNYIKIAVGNGALLLHSNPIFFSNRHLIRADGYEHIGKVLSYLPQGNIYWDKQNKPIKIKKPAMEGNEDDTPFTYILKQKSFRWAFYLIYFAVGLFLIFNLFRKQKQIPVLFQNKNTSLEFIKNVGTLYYENKDNKQLAEKIMRHFMNEVRLKYFINEKTPELVVKKLAQKTKVEEAIIQNIFNGYKIIENKVELSDEGLINFYLKIEKFQKLTANK